MAISSNTQRDCTRRHCGSHYNFLNEKIVLRLNDQRLSLSSVQKQLGNIYSPVFSNQWIIRHEVRI